MPAFGQWYGWAQQPRAGGRKQVAKAKAEVARAAEETHAPTPLAKMAAAVEPRDSDFSDLASTYLEGELGVDGVPATSDEGDFSSLSGMVCEL